MVEDEAEPLGLLELAELPLGPLLAVALDVLGPEVPPAPGLLVPPVPLEAEPPGVVVVVVVDDEVAPPGVTTVSFSFVVVEAVGPDPPGTTVVVSLRSHADSARAPTTNNR